MKSFNLENHPKIKPGFATPENYFEQFSEKLLASIPSEEKPVISIFAKNKKWLMAVAAVLILAIMIPFLNKTNSENQNLDTASLENYLAYQTTISPDELVSLLDYKDIEAIETDLNLDDATLESALSGNNYIENYITE